MEHIDVVLATIAARHRGLVPHGEAVAAGISDTVLRRRHRAGLLVREHEGLYRHVAAAPTRESRWLAAVMACGSDAVLSHRAAAALHGFPGVRQIRPEVTSPHRDRPRVDRFPVHRTNRLEPVDVVRRLGIPVTAPARTALDLCAVLPFELALPAVEGAVITKLVSVPALLSVLERVGGRGRRGSAGLRHIVRSGLMDDGVESMLELALARLLAMSHVPAPVRQHALVCRDGRPVVLDNAWPDVRLAVEGDGMRWHATRATWEQTQSRSRSIQGTGWIHLVYGWGSVEDDPEGVRREVEQAYRRLAVVAA